VAEYAASISLLSAAGVCGRSRSQLHIAHELAGALQQAGQTWQRCAVKEPQSLVHAVETWKYRGGVGRGLLAAYADSL